MWVTADRSKNSCLEITYTALANGLREVAMARALKSSAILSCVHIFQLSPQALHRLRVDAPSSTLLDVTVSQPSLPPPFLSPERVWRRLER